MIHSIRALSVTLLLIFLLVSSCKDDPTSTNEEPPSLPPAQSMYVEMDLFENSSNQQSGNYFTDAVLGTIAVKSVTNASLIVPRVLLPAAASTDAELNEDNEWVWEYSQKAGQRSYEVRLIATELNEDRVQWDFYATSSPLELNDQLIFSGEANSDGSEGTWTYFFESEEISNEAVSSVTWEVNGENDISIRLDVLSEEHAAAGDYIAYTFNGTIKHLAHFDASEEVTTEIQWDVETEAGFIVKYEVKKCWDSDFQDTACEDT